jgi:hypothetical protein
VMALVGTAPAAPPSGPKRLDDSLPGGYEKKGKTPGSG